MLTMLETKERNWRNETEERNKNGESYFIVKPGICPVARNRASRSSPILAATRKPNIQSSFACDIIKKMKIGYFNYPKSAFWFFINIKIVTKKQQQSNKVTLGAFKQNTKRNGV